MIILRVQYATLKLAWNHHTHWNYRWFPLMTVSSEVVCDVTSDVGLVNLLFFLIFSRLLWVKCLCSLSLRISLSLCLSLLFFFFSNFPFLQLLFFSSFCADIYLLKWTSSSHTLPKVILIPNFQNSSK